MNPEVLTHQHHDEHLDERKSDFLDWVLSRTGVATVVVVSVLAFLIYEGHSAHLLGALPYLLILSCPLIHFFMHGGHHRHTQGNRIMTGKVSDGSRDGQ